MKKILFIEDESALQRAVTHRLKDKNYEVYSALDGIEGIKKAKEIIPDLILLDLVLPKKDGFSIMEELKQNPATNKIPIIILSNLENSTDVDRALAAGAKTYLVKTAYELEEVIEKIKKVFD